MTAGDAGSSPRCSRCGKPQPPTGPLRTSDGTEISASTYLALAGLAGEALVCPDCVSSPDASGNDLVGGPSEPSRASPPRCTETLLDERECRRLLRTQPIGRLAFTEHALPVIVPAHFLVRGPEIILSGPADGRLDCARKEAIVAFGVDAYDATTGQGWWVCTLGRSRLISDTSQIRELDELAFTPWAHDPDRAYMAIAIDALRGKRLAPTGQPDH